MRWYKTSLFRFLALPLLAVIAISLWLTPVDQLPGLPGNVFAEALGLLATVVYVDWAIKRHDSEKWHTPTLLIAKRLRRVAFLGITNTRISLGLKGTEVMQIENMPADIGEAQKQYLRLIEHKVEPQISDRLRALDEAGWGNLIAALTALIDELDNMLSLFGDRLPAERYAEVLDVRDNASHLVISYETMRDLYWLPPERLAPSVIDAKEQLTKRAVETVRAMFVALRSLAAYWPSETP